MPLDVTVSQVDCIPQCPSRELSEPEFLLLLIDRLVTLSGVELGDITQADLLATLEEGICDLQDRTVYYNSSPEKLRAVALYLLSQVA